NFLARLDPDAAGALVDHVAGGVMTEDFLGRDQQVLESVLGRLVGRAGGNLLPGGEHFLTGLGVDQREARLGAAPLLGRERHLPAIAGFTRNALPDDGLVEVMEDLLAVEPEG